MNIDSQYLNKWYYPALWAYLSQIHNNTKFVHIGKTVLRKCCLFNHKYIGSHNL